MNTNQASASWRGHCIGCGEPFTEWGWDLRHDINDDDAHHHRIDPGDYHDKCCPLPACATQVVEVAS